MERTGKLWLSWAGIVLKAGDGGVIRHHSQNKGWDKLNVISGALKEKRGTEQPFLLKNQQVKSPQPLL